MDKTVILNYPCDSCSGTGGRVEYDPEEAEYPGDDWHWKPCCTCAGKQFFEKRFSTTELEPMAARLLKSCNWFIRYSDCVESKRREAAKQHFMHQILALIDRQTATCLWKKCSPLAMPDYL